MSIPAEAFGSVTQQTRRWLANSLREKVVGDGMEDKARRVWTARGPRWFVEGDPIWTVHADAAMFVGGIRALLLQSLHPLAMAGVAGHSGYRSDPWGRLARTSAYLAVTTFGTVAQAEESVANVRAIHERVRGRTEDGRAYSAADPHLLAWVHVAEADSFLASHRRYGEVTLTPAEEDRYVAQSGSVAARLGVVDPPMTVAELADVLDTFRPELESSTPALEAARYLLLHPPIGWSERAGYAALAAGAVALLPVWAKEMLRLPVLPLTERAVSAPAADLAVRAIRWAMSDPSNLRNENRAQSA